MRHATSILVVLSLSACGGMAKAPSTTSAARSCMSVAHAPPPALASTDDKKAEIARRFREIQIWRQESGLPSEASVDEAVAVERQSTDTVRGTLTTPLPGQTQSCTSICTLKDSICDNSEAICRLAVDLNDDWSTEKCSSAKASCKTASEKCTDCSPLSPESEAKP